MAGTRTRTQAERMACGFNGQNRTAAALAAAVWMTANGYCLEEIREYIQRRYLSAGNLDNSAVQAFEIFFAAKSYEEALFTAKPYGGGVQAMVAQLAEAYYCEL